MQPQPSHRTARRLAAGVLLALALPALVGGPEAHLGHGAAEAQTPVFSEASHAGQPNHWDDADAARNRRCPDCLAPPQTLEPARAGAGRLPAAGDGMALPREASRPTAPWTDRSRNTRAPPPS